MSETTNRRKELALARYAEARAALAAAGEHPPRAGDLYALPLTAAWPVEWALIGPAERPDHWLAVPADTHPLAGSADVALAASSPVAPLTLRCRFAVPIAAAQLRPEWRGGALAAAEVEQVRRACEALREGRLTVDVAGEEVDSSPEYRHWIRAVVEPAAAAAAAATGTAPPGTIPSDGEAERGQLLAFPADRPRRALTTRLLGLAASLLAAVSLTLGGGLLVQSQRGERERAENAAASSRLEGELRAAGAARERERTAHREELARLEREHRAALERAAGAAGAAPSPQPRPVVNLPFAWLRPIGDSTRGEETAVTLTPTADVVALILPIDQPGRFARFRVEVTAEGGRPVWRSDELVRTGLAETSLALPRSLLPPGHYTIRLSGLGGESPQPLATYRLVIAPDR